MTAAQFQAMLPRMKNTPARRFIGGGYGSASGYGPGEGLEVQTLREGGATVETFAAPFGTEAARAATLANVMLAAWLNGELPGGDE